MKTATNKQIALINERLGCSITYSACRDVKRILTGNPLDDIAANPTLAPRELMTKMLDALGGLRLVRVGGYIYRAELPIAQPLSDVL